MELQLKDLTELEIKILRLENEYLKHSQIADKCNDYNSSAFKYNISKAEKAIMEQRCLAYSGGYWRADLMRLLKNGCIQSYLLKLVANI